MADPQTVNTGLSVPTRGSDVGTWDLPVNGDFTAIDGFFGGIQTLAVSSTSFTLTAPAGFTATPSAGPTQSQNAVLRFTGVLTNNVVVTLPLPGYMIAENLTTGAFSLYLAAPGGGEEIILEPGAIHKVYNDGTNVRWVDLPPIGSYLDICDATVPTWIANSSKPPYLNCDGSTFSAVTYPYLNAKLGGNVLPDLRGVSRYTLNQGTGRLTTAGSGLDGNTRFSLKTTQTVTLGTPNLPSYTPAGGFTGVPQAKVGVSTGFGGGGAIQALVQNGNGNQANDFTTAIPLVIGTLAFAGSAQGGSSQPFGTVGPGTISGITLIRAG